MSRIASMSAPEHLIAHCQHGSSSTNAPGSRETFQPGPLLSARASAPSDGLLDSMTGQLVETTAQISGSGGISDVELVDGRLIIAGVNGPELLELDLDHRLLQHHPPAFGQRRARPDPVRTSNGRETENTNSPAQGRSGITPSPRLRGLTVRRRRFRVIRRGRHALLPIRTRRTFCRSQRSLPDLDHIVGIVRSTRRNQCLYPTRFTFGRRVCGVTAVDKFTW